MNHQSGTSGLKPLQLNTDRRRLLKHSLAAIVTALAGCGGGSDASSPLGSTPAPAPTPTPTPTPAPPPAPEVWNPSVPPLLVGANSTFNLAATLPVGITRGGRFGLDSSGASLPAGMTLSSGGVLAVGSASIGTVTGVIFTYETP